MKRFFVYFLALFLTIGVSSVCQAQKFGYIDSEKILTQMTEYKEAQQEIDRLAIKYQQEIEVKYNSLDSMKQAYQREELLLTKQMRDKRIAEISEKEAEIKTFQKKIFGFEGLIFLKRQELIKPIQQKIYDAVKKVAQRERLQIVFDKSSSLTMIYSNPVHDYTDYVLEELGLGDPDDKIDNPR